VARDDDVRERQQAREDVVGDDLAGVVAAEQAVLLLRRRPSATPPSLPLLRRVHQIARVGPRAAARWLISQAPSRISRQPFVPDQVARVRRQRAVQGDDLRFGEQRGSGT
jgi:FAD synthase